ncbi:hypothetical protein AB0D08_29855 [Kitasatospora sp. NPDC048540]|uniref:hypothetical protein n=1 Tax=unclassified Kitasatospora TaxID=2633591 RepID=UPI00068AB463|nr:hypothetical protein [Kitasatospora sp. MBT63]
MTDDHVTDDRVTDDRVTAPDGLVTDQRFGADELPVLRAVVTHCATLAGAGVEHRDLFVFAVHEVAGSLVAAPGPDVRVVISRPDPATLVCRITEDGPGATDGAPRLRWPAGELDGALRVDRLADRTTVTLRLPDDRPAGGRAGGDRPGPPGRRSGPGRHGRPAGPPRPE